MPGLVRGVARTAVIAGTATAVSNRVSRRQVEHWSEQAAEDGGQQAPATYQQPQYQPAPPPPPAPAASSTNDMLAQLKALGDLHASGILTDDEFAEQKAKILSS
jgi:hypothetical protein